METAEDLLRDAIRSEELARMLLKSGETQTAQRFFEDRDWFLRIAADMEKRRA